MSTAGRLSPLCASPCALFGAATTATSPPVTAPASSNAPIETHQRISGPPSSMRIVTRKMHSEKYEDRLCFTFRLSAPGAAISAAFSAGTGADDQQLTSVAPGHH